MIIRLTTTTTTTTNNLYTLGQVRLVCDLIKSIERESERVCAYILCVIT